MVKGHPPPSKMRRDILITTVLVSAGFCAILYVQALLYGQCAEPHGIATVEQLQEYLLRYASVLDGSSPEAEAARGVHLALGHTIRNATLLPAKEAEIVRLNGKLTDVHQEALTAQNKLQKAQEQQVQLESCTNQVKALETEKTELQKLKQQNEQLEKDKADLQQKQQQVEKEKHELEQKLQQAGSSSSSSGSNNGTASEAELNAAKMRALAVAGDMCYTTQDYEFWWVPPDLLHPMILSMESAMHAVVEQCWSNPQHVEQQSTLRPVSFKRRVPCVSAGC